MNLTEIIAHLRELEKKATPGEWKSQPAPPDPITSGGRVISEEGLVCLGFSPENEKLIAESRNHLTRLLDELEAAKEVLEWYADGFKIMDHIDGSYTIHETWHQKARALLEKWK